VGFASGATNIVVREVDRRRSLRLDAGDGVTNAMFVPPCPDPARPRRASSAPILAAARDRVRCIADQRGRAVALDRDVRLRLRAGLRLTETTGRWWR